MNLDFLAKFWEFFLLNKASIFLIIIAISVEFIAKYIKNKNKKIVLSEYGETLDQENSEFHLQYYKKNQILDFIRVISSISLIAGLFAINTDVGLGFFAVATGAMIMAFRDFILSVLAFFFVTPSYPIGQTVRVAGLQGQIIFIRMLSVGILGKDDRGENTGELHIVPSNKFITDVVHKKEVTPNAIFKDFMEIPYYPEKFILPFPEFMKELRKFLWDNFPLRNANNVGNFTSYIGHRYKLNFHFEEDNYGAIMVKFVGKIAENNRHKEKIMEFVYSQMKPLSNTEEKIWQSE